MHLLIRTRSFYFILNIKLGRVQIIELVYNFYDK